MDTNKTRELFAPLIQKPTLTNQLLQRPPFKFLHDIVRETLRSTGYSTGLFSEDELNATIAGSSRENKIAFLQKLIDVLNIDGNLDNVKAAKIVAGKEPEMTNKLLQSLAFEAASFKHEKKKTAEKTTISKTSNSSKLQGEKSSKTKSTKSSSSKTKNKNEEPSIEKKSSRTKESRTSLSKETKEKERKKKKSGPEKISEISSKALNNTSLVKTEQRPTSITTFDENKTNELPDSRRTPQDRESSGSTSKGGDDSGIADETGAESERHDLSAGGGRYGSVAAGIVAKSDSAKPEFIEIHSPRPTPEIPSIRPGSSIGRPQTSIGRPGTAIARPAPPKPKRNVIVANVKSENEELNKEIDVEQTKFILKDKKEELEENAEFLIQEHEEGQFLMDLGKAEGVNVSKLEEGDNHGILVNKIIENTRELEKDHIQIGETLNETDGFIDLHEQRRLRNEIDSAQKSLQKTTQLLQPLIHTFEFAADNFDAVLKELEDCRRQSKIVEQQLNEHLQKANSQTTKLNATLHALDSEIFNIREKIAITTATILRNEQKMSELIAAKSN